MKRIGGGLLMVLCVSQMHIEPAHAQGFVSPQIGVVFGGDTEAEALALGGALGVVGGFAGIEVDGHYASDVLDGGDADIVADSSVTTLTVNLLIGPRLGGGGGGVMPYVAGGVGLLRTRVESVGGFFDDVTANDLAVDVGGGAMVFVNDRIGLRGDLRYYRSLTTDDDEVLGVDLADLDFWRTMFGVVFRF